MPTLSNGSELTYLEDQGATNQFQWAFKFFLTPPGGTPTEFGGIPDFLGFGSIELAKIDVLDGYFAISAFSHEGRISDYTDLDTYIYANDGTLVRTIHDADAASRSGRVDSIDFQDPDDVTVTWTHATNYSSGKNTQYGPYEVIIENGVPQPFTFVNHTPTVANLSFTLAPGQSLDDVKFTSSDPDYDLLKFVVVDRPDHGTLTQSTRYDAGFYPFPQSDYIGDLFYHRAFLDGNLFDYAPTPGFVGTDTFTVYGSDGQANSQVATISITVSGGSGGAQYIALTNGPDTARFFTSTHPVLVAALGGNDDISGSRFDDSINGGTGNDLLRGELGRDKITGGEGADRVQGGAGNDTFNFVAGDLADPLQTPGRYDHVVDFHGAGNSGPGEQDFLRFSGFGDDATLSFARYGSADHLKQLYAVTDPDNPDNSGFILVQMADGPGQLAHGDYLFV